MLAFMWQRILDEAARPRHCMIRTSPRLIATLFPRLEGEGKALLSGSAFTPLTWLERQDHAAELRRLGFAFRVKIDPAPDELLGLTLGDGPAARNPYVLPVFDLSKVAQSVSLTAADEMNSCH